MRRLILPIVTASTLMLTCVSAASAQSYSIPEGAAIAVTNQFVYWERLSPRSCRNCGELWRVPIAGGSKQLVDRMRKGEIGFLEAGGNVMAYTTMQDGKRYRTEVRAISDEGQRATLARAAYRKSGGKSCGTEVSSGAVSRAGEVAWQKVDVRSPGAGCNQLYGDLYWSAYAGGLGSPARRLVAPRPRDINLFEAGDYTDILEWVSPVLAFEGATLLAGAPFGTLEIFRVPDGEAVPVTAGAKSGFSGLADLASNGAIYANLLLPDPSGRDDFFESAQLLLQPGDPAKRVDLNIAGQLLPAAHFCGDQLVQLTSGKNRLQMTRRSLDGTILGSQELLSGDGEYESWFQCNETKLVVQYEAWNQKKKKDRHGTIGVALTP